MYGKLTVVLSSGENVTYTDMAKDRISVGPAGQLIIGTLDMFDVYAAGAWTNLRWEKAGQ